MIRKYYSYGLFMMAGVFAFTTGCSGSNCSDECTSGTKACESNTLMTCGDYNGDGCVEWGDPYTCPDQCQIDHCISNCSNECPSGTRRCAGDGFQVCSDSNGDGCTEWGNTQSCGTGKVCTGDGICSDQCVSQCGANQHRCVPGENKYQDCVCSDDACCDWGDPVECDAGQSCSNGQCVSCENECSPAGARQCADGTSFQVCGNIDDDPCTEWSEPSDCDQGMVCVKGTCTIPCEDECSGTGARACTEDNRGYKTCGNYDTDSCLEWGDTKECEPTEICSEGVCQFNCADECAAGEARCLGNGFQTCGQYDDDPCTEWSKVSECKHNETCSNGVCSATCQDECTAGAVECSGFQSYRECGEFDHDPCTDWGEPQNCALWERCLDNNGPAECVIICFNDCDVAGEQVCAGDGYEVCEDNDWDACLEWSDVIPCGEGELCSENPETGQGACTTMPCTDDCDTEGQKTCYQDAAYRTCGYFDNDSCLDWSQVTECGSGKVCEAGQCVANCEDECESGQLGCNDAASRWVCTDADGDGCLEKVSYDCAGDEVCSDGICAVDCVNDNLEPNNDFDNTSPVDEGVQTGLVICPSDEDWFDVYLDAGQGLSVTISFDNSQGDLDMELYSLDDLQNPVAVSAGISDSETVVVPSVAESSFFLVRVYGYGSASNQYNLSVDIVDQGECLDDYLEENDTMDNAKFVLDGDYENLNLCVGDEDWYENYMFAGESLIVNLSFVYADGDLDMDVYNEDGDLLATANSTDDGEHISVSIDADGSYFVRVYPYDQDSNSYSMIIAYGEACQDDLYEPNDDMEHASEVGAETINSLVLCGNNLDWFAVTLAAPGDLLASIDFTHADGDLDLYLYSSDGTMIDYSTSTTDDEMVGVEGLEAGTYFLKVVGWQGAENTYDLEVVY